MTTKFDPGDTIFIEARIVKIEIADVVYYTLQLDDDVYYRDLKSGLIETTEPHIVAKDSLEE